MTLRHLARVIGKLVSSFPAVQFCPIALHYRILKVAKTKALQNSKGNFDSMTILSGAMKLEISWRIDNIISSSCLISYTNPDLSILILMHPCLNGVLSVILQKHKESFFLKKFKTIGVILIHWSFWQLSIGFSVLKI